MKKSNFSVGANSTSQQFCRENCDKSGFTIVELLVVIVVIGILAAITIVSYTGISQKATKVSLQSDLVNASTQLKLDQVINGVYPTVLANANSNKGIPSSTGTTYQYFASNGITPQTFCLTATNGAQSYNINQDGVISLGGRNLLGNTSQSLSGWALSGTARTDVQPDPQGGSSAVALNYNGAIYSNIGYTSFIPTSMTTYTASIWVKTNDGSTKTLDFYLYRLAPWSFGFGNAFVITPSWQRISVSGIPADLTTHYLYLIDNVGGGVVKNIVAYGAKLELGNTATCWTPGP